MTIAKTSPFDLRVSVDNSQAGSFDFEEWRPVVGYEGSYEVSNMGRIKSLPKKRKTYGGTREMHYPEKILACVVKKNGYVEMSLQKNDKQMNEKMHRMVAEAFIPNPFCKPHVNHIDCDKLNNRVENLEWCTRKENARHAVENGRYYFPRKNKKVMKIDKNGNLLKIYESVKSACADICANENNVMSAINGNQPTAAGYIWKYA